MWCQSKAMYYRQRRAVRARVRGYHTCLLKLVVNLLPALSPSEVRLHVLDRRLDVAGLPSELCKEVVAVLDLAAAADSAGHLSGHRRQLSRVRVFGLWTRRRGAVRVTDDKIR